MASLKDVIVKDPDILSGTPVFRGTRVPLQALFDSIESGETLEAFLEGFPSVSGDGRRRPRTGARTVVKGSRHEPLIALVMRILLDECVDQRLRNYLPGHTCPSAQYAGPGGLKNGEFLAAAESAGFDVLLTVDRGFQYEQNLRGRKIAVIVLSTKSIALKDLLARMPECLTLLLTIKPGEVAKVPERN